MLLTLQSERILLQNLQADDLADFLSYRCNPEVTRYQGFDPYNEQQALDFILSQKDKELGTAGQWLQLAIILKKENKLIGDCAVKLVDDNSQTAELGCTLSPAYQGKGFAKETLLTLMAFLFEEKNVHRIMEITDAENISSIHLLESIGFRKEGHFIENTWFKGKWGSELQYALLDKEWAGVKKKNIFN